MASVPDPSDFATAFGTAISPPDAFLDAAAVINGPACWIKNLKMLWDAADQFPHDNTALRDQVTALEISDDELQPAKQSVAEDIGAQNLLKESVKELTEKLRLAESSGTRSTKSATHPDPNKFNDDRVKLDLFITRFYLKLIRNADHYERARRRLQAHAALCHCHEDRHC